MKHYFLLALAIIALIVSGCKNENQKTDPQSTTDNGKRDFVIHIYLTPDMIDSLNNEVYLTLPHQQETKLALDKFQELDATMDKVALGELENYGLDVSYLKAYEYKAQGDTGELKLRWNLSLKCDSFTTKPTFCQGYMVQTTSAAKGTQMYGNTIIHKGVKLNSVQKVIDGINDLDFTEDIK